MLENGTAPEPCPQYLYSAKQVKAIDQIAIKTQYASGFELMQKAAQFSFDVLVKRWPNSKQILVLCGSGNNAGDGYIVATLAKIRGYEVQILSLSNPLKLKGDALLAYQYSQDHGLTSESFSYQSWPKYSVNSDYVIVDALLGTGLNCEVSGDYLIAIEMCNKSEAPVVSVDIPSGLCADTGQVRGIAVEANCTATFIALKTGQLLGNGKKYCGELFFNDLGIPGKILQQVDHVAKKIDLPTLTSKLMPRSIDAHKGSYGHVLLIGGDHGYGGAITMAAEAAARMGAGLVSVATRSEHCAVVLNRVPEVMANGVNHIAQLTKLINKASVLVIGPGLGQSLWSRQMLTTALKHSMPTILDADAINLICQYPEIRSNRKTNHIMTPHPGEASRLMQCNTEDIQSDRLSAVVRIQEKLGGTIVLKGNSSLIAHANEAVQLCPYGNPGMATGGTGDVLSGMLGGLIAQEFDQQYAIELAVCLHSVAADIVANTHGQRGLLASDIVPIARKLLNGIITL